MAITPVGTATGGSGLGTGPAMTITTPSGISAGNVLALHFCFDGALTDSSIPSGWTLRLDPAAAPNLKVYTKVVQAGDPTSYNFTWTGTPRPHNWFCEAYSGVDTVTPVEATASAVDFTADVTLSIPSVTTLSNNAMVLHSLAILRTGTGTVTPPGGSTEVVDNDFTLASTQHYGLEVSRFVQATAGATGTRSATASANNIDTVTAGAVVLKPSQPAATDLIGMVGV